MIVPGDAVLVCPSKEGIMQIKKAYLIFASVAVTIFGLLYGISPTWYAVTFLGITDLNTNFAHILRAIAGLYLALAAFWFYAAFNDKYRDAGILTAILFAGGLAAGRCVSLIGDGQPALVLLIYGVMEFAVVLVGLWVFRLPQR
jgi:NAD/NADP transhydrogenase beta subunit